MTTSKKNTSQVREVALEVIIEVLEKGGYSHKVLGQALTKYQYLDKQERAFLSRLCEGTIERAIELDYIINQFSKVKVKKQKPVIRNILRMAVYQIRYMDAVPDSAACNEAVKLGVKKGFGTLRGFINGVLRNISRNQEEITYPDQAKEPIKYLSIKYSMPEWIVLKWMKEYDYKTVEGILEKYNQSKATTIRTNLLKTTPEELKASLEKAGVTVKPASYMPYAFYISNYNYLSNLEEFREGLFQVQDESSMLVGEIADVKEDNIVIDVCAAPGGKTLHMAEKLKGTGMVYSRDLTYEKTAYIEENVLRLGIENVSVEARDALVLDQDSVGKADVVICDLPCSGLGVIGKKPDIKYKITEEQLSDLSKLQQEILKVVTTYVKPGGTLIYSTCTINKAENEDNMNFIVKELGFKLENIDTYLPKTLQNETTKEGYLQLIPGIHNTDGFFISRLKKVQ
ncbi:MAG: 16S rRNA (cytosine(967)-C(5))-methyltransferase RsmB [bacterium]|nr:16S rRNA (cytosine(967)-C(5))-methyltransferase RsmB [bacterium]